MASASESLKVRAVVTAVLFDILFSVAASLIIAALAGVSIAAAGSAEELQRAMSAPRVVIPMTVVGALLTVAGGWVAAHVAGRAELVHALATGAVLTALGLPALARDDRPMWIHVVSLGLTIPAACVGGALRAARRWRPQGAGPQRELTSTCPTCAETVQRSAAAVCVACRTAHHVACWDDLGRCTKCSGAARIEPEGAPPTTNPWRVVAGGGALTVAGTAALVLGALPRAPAPAPAAPSPRPAPAPEVPSGPPRGVVTGPTTLEDTSAGLEVSFAALEPEAPRAAPAPFGGGPADPTWAPPRAAPGAPWGGPPSRPWHDTGIAREQDLRRALCDGERLVLVRARQVDVHAGEAPPRSIQLPGPTYTAVLAGNRAVVSYADRDQVSFVDLDRAEVVKTVELGSPRPADARVRPGLATDVREPRRVQVVFGTELVTLDAGRAAVVARVTIEPTETYLPGARGGLVIAHSTRSETLNVIDVASGKTLRTLGNRNGHPFTPCAFDPAGRFLFTAYGAYAFDRGERLRNGSAGFSDDDLTLAGVLPGGLLLGFTMKPSLVYLEPRRLEIVGTERVPGSGMNCHVLVVPGTSRVVLVDRSVSYRDLTPPALERPAPLALRGELLEATPALEEWTQPLSFAGAAPADVTAVTVTAPEGAAWDPKARVLRWTPARPGSVMVEGTVTLRGRPPAPFEVPLRVEAARAAAGGGTVAVELPDGRVAEVSRPGEPGRVSLVDPARRSRASLTFARPVQSARVAGKRLCLLLASNELVVLDAATLAPQARWALPGTPGDLVVHPAGDLTWFDRAPEPTTMHRLDLGSGELRSVVLEQGVAPADRAFDWRGDPERFVLHGRFYGWRAAPGEATRVRPD